MGLALESSTYLGSVALLSGWHVVEEVRVPMKGQYEERMMPAVSALLDRAGVSPRDLGMIMCGAGPGSFTSLRVSAAIAKGLAHGLRIPLLVASSLLLVPAGAEPSLAEAMEQAKRMQCAANLKGFANSFAISTLATVLSLGVTVTSGYMLSRFRGPIPNAWFSIIYVLRCVPYISWVLPLFFVTRQWGIFDTYWGLLLPHVAVHICFFSWIMKGTPASRQVCTIRSQVGRSGPMGFWQITGTRCLAAK